MESSSARSVLAHRTCLRELYLDCLGQSNTLYEGVMPQICGILRSHGLLDCQ